MNVPPNDNIDRVFSKQAGTPSDLARGTSLSQTPLNSPAEQAWAEELRAAGKMSATEELAASGADTPALAAGVARSRLAQNNLQQRYGAPPSLDRTQEQAMRDVVRMGERGSPMYPQDEIAAMRLLQAQMRQDASMLPLVMQVAGTDDQNEATAVLNNIRASTAFDDANAPATYESAIESKQLSRLNPYRAEVLGDKERRALKDYGDIVLDPNTSPEDRLAALTEWMRIDRETAPGRDVMERQAAVNLAKKRTGYFTYDDYIAWYYKTEGKDSFLSSWTKWPSYLTVGDAGDPNRTSGSYGAGWVWNNVVDAAGMALQAPQRAGESVYNLIVRDVFGGTPLTYTDNMYSSEYVIPQLAGGIAQFYVGYGPAAALMKVGKAGTAGNLIRAAAAGEIAAAVVFDPRLGNLSTMLREFGIGEEALAAFDAKELTEEGKGFRGRLVSFLEGAILSGVVEVATPGIKAAARAAGGGSRATMANTIRYLEKIGGLDPDSILKTMPRPIREAAISKDTARAVAELTAYGVERSRRMGQLLKDGMTHEEALVKVQQEFPLGQYVDGVRRVTRAMIASSFNVAPDQADVLFRRFTAAGLDWERIFFTLPDNVSERMHKLLYEGAEQMRQAGEEGASAIVRGGVGEDMGLLINDAVAVFSTKKNWWKKKELWPEGVVPESLTEADVQRLPGQLRTMAEDALRELRDKYSPQDGWSTPTIAAGTKDEPSLKFDIDDEGNFKAIWKFEKQGHTFHLDEMGDALQPGSPKWQARVEDLAAKMVDEVRVMQSVAQQSGDSPIKTRMLAVMSAGRWYRDIAENVRGLYGPYSDIFAELLGATSAKTPVATNWRYATDILRQFTSGMYDDQMAKYVAHLEESQAYDVRYAETEKRIREAGSAERGEARKAAIAQLREQGMTYAQAVQEVKGKFSAPSAAEVASLVEKEVGLKPEFAEELKIRSDVGNLFGSNTESAMRVLAGMWATVKYGSNPKTRNFTKNLLGDFNMATVDVWAARTLQRLANMPRVAMDESAAGTLWERLGEARRQESGRIAPSAEEGVQGTYGKEAGAIVDPATGAVTGATRGFGISGAYGVGAEAFSLAAQRLNDVVPGITAADLQAIMWFAEKDHWHYNLGQKLDLGSFEKGLRRDFAGEGGRYISGTLGGQPGRDVAEAGAKAMEESMAGDPNMLFKRATLANGTVAGRDANGFIVDVGIVNYEMPLEGGPFEGTNIVGPKTGNKRQLNQASADAVVSRMAKHAKESDSEAFYVARIVTPLTGAEVQVTPAAKGGQKVADVQPVTVAEGTTVDAARTIGVEFEFANPLSETSPEVKRLRDSFAEFGMQFESAAERATNNVNGITRARSIYVPDFDPQIIAMSDSGATAAEIASMITKRKRQFTALVERTKKKPFLNNGGRATSLDVEIDVYHSHQFDELIGPQSAAEGTENATEAVARKWQPDSPQDRIYRNSQRKRDAATGIDASPDGQSVEDAVGAGAVRATDGDVSAQAPNVNPNDGTKILFNTSGAQARAVAAIEEQTGIAFIAGLNMPDIVSATHEFGHALRNQLLNRNLPIERRAGIPDTTIDAFEQAYGVVNGTWTRDQEEAFADDLVSLLQDGTAVPARLAGVGRDEQLIMASWLRDQWRVARNAPASTGVPTDTRRLLENLYYRTDLPIQYAPGRYLMPIDHSAVIARIQQAQSNGEDWLQVINPNDALGTARMHVFDGRPTMRDPATGRFRRGTDRERAFASPDGRNLTPTEMADLRTRAAAGDADATRQLADIDARREHIRDNLRFFENPDDPLIYMAYFESLAREMEARNMLGGPATRDQLTRRSLSLFNELLMNNADDLSQGIASMWARMNDVSRIDTELPAFVSTVQLAVQGQLRQVHRLAQRAVQTNNPADFALLQRSFFDLQMLRFHMRNTKTAMGRGLKALDPQMLPNAAELRDLRNARNFLEQNGFVDDIGRPLAETLARIDPDVDPNAAVRILNDVWRPGEMRRGNLLLEVYRNGLLSLPRSWFGLQVISPPLVLGVEGLQKLAVAGIRGDMLTATETLRNLPRMIANMNHGLRFAARTFVEERPTLMPHGTGIVQDTFVPAIHSDQQNILGTMINAGGRGVRLPSTFIATIDEFWKQVTARTEMHSSLYRRLMQERMTAAGVTGWRDQLAFMRANHRAVSQEADAMGQRYIRDGAIRDRTMIGREAFNDPRIAAEQDPLRRASMMHDYVNQHWTQDQQQTTAGIAEAANRQSFTEPIPGLGGAVRHHLQQSWWLQLVVPFYTAPVNILRRAWGYLTSPIMVGGDVAVGLATERRLRINPNSRLYRFHHQTMLDMASGDPARISRAQGQVLVGMTALGTGYALFQDGRLTGAGPADPEQRRMWQQTGRQPYSVKIGDRWYVYNKLDPFGMMLGWMADYHELTSGMYENDEEEVIGPATAIAYALTMTTINKSYMMNLDMLMEANDDPVKMEQVIGRMGLTALPPTSIASSLQAGVLRASDPYAVDPLGGVKADEGLGKEVEVLLNEMRAKSWWGQAAGGRDVMARRYSALGEPIRTFDPMQDYPWVDIVSPVVSRKAQDDAVIETMVNMPHIWRSTPPNKDGVNLKQVRVPQTSRTAYDLYNENIASVTMPFPMGDGTQKKLTLRQALQHIVEGKGAEGRMFKSFTDTNPENYPGENPPDIAMFVRVIERYRTAAWQQTLVASPELRAVYDERRRALIESRKKDAARMNENRNSELEAAVEAATR
jgi:hypothetical protein